MPTSEVLAPADQPAALAGTPLGQSGLIIPTEAGFVLVVKEQGQTVATWAAYTVVHLEGCWIAPEKRHSPSVVKALVEGMFDELRARGLQQVLTVTQSDEVGRLAEHLGGQPVGQLWVIPVPPEET